MTRCFAGSRNRPKRSSGPAEVFVNPLTEASAPKMALEAALEYIEDDELVEITPNSVRTRKVLLKESDRKRAARRGD